jgi:hypothetical protein
MPEHKSGHEIERVFKVRHIPENIEKYPQHKKTVGSGLAMRHATGSRKDNRYLTMSFASRPDGDLNVLAERN